MRIIQGRLSDSVKSRIREIDLDDQSITTTRSNSFLLQRITINNEQAFLQRHSITLEKGDEVTAGGFKLFGMFMIMAIKNQSRDEFWSNNAFLQILLGLFIASVPFWVTGESPANYSQNAWLFMVIPFVLIGVIILAYGLTIMKVAQKVKTAEVHIAPKAQTAEELEDAKLDQIADKIANYLIAGLVVFGVLLFLYSLSR